MKTALLGLLLLSTIGCSVYQPPPPTTAQITTSPYDGLLAAFDAAPTVTARNRIILRAKLAIDGNYQSFAQSFLLGQGYIQTGTEIAALGLSQAAALTNLGTSHLLSIISGGITGSSAIYQKNIFSGVTRWVIIGQMNADRASQEFVLNQDMASCLPSGPCGSPGVSVEQAVIDLVSYYNAGSIMNALTELQAASGQQALTARQAMRALRSQHP